MSGTAALARTVLGARLAPTVRSVPLRSRILAIPIANAALAVILLLVIWNGAQHLTAAWSDLRRVQESERFLTGLGADSERLQGLIHRYNAGADPSVLARIVELREALDGRLRVQARLDPLLAGPAENLIGITARLVQGFDDLRDAREEVSDIYRKKVLQPSREMAGLYGIVGGAIGPDSVATLAPVVGKSREAFNDLLLSANSFYLSGAASAAKDAQTNAALIARTAPVIEQGLGDPIQRRAVEELQSRALVVSGGLGELADGFARRNRLLGDVVDGNAEAMSDAIDGMRTVILGLQQSAQRRFDETLGSVALKLAVLSVAFVGLVLLMGFAIARSVSDPLRALRADMMAVMSGRFDRPVAGLAAGDEIGEMARAVDVFRGDAVAKVRAEDELRGAKEKAETTLAEIAAIQTTLIETEKLAALGGLVAGVAHEVNNPVGISLTVASSLERRSEIFAAEAASGPIRRSRLDDFVGATRLASGQLVANLQRAAELIQAFKQVAVDRSHGERRSLDLADAAEQILSSLRPSLKAAGARLVVDIPPGITMHTDPGALGQILTNLVLNAVGHAFAGAGTAGAGGGTVSVVARRSGPNEVRLVFRDDGQGMSEDVQRHAFDPFYTTRRGSGGTGLGLHIVYNLVTQRLGGRIVLSSAPGTGTSFLLVLPLQSPPDEDRTASGNGRATGQDEHGHVAS